MRCVATEILLVVGVAVDTLVWLNDGLATAAATDTDGFFVSMARRRRLKGTRK